MCNTVIQFRRIVNRYVERILFYFIYIAFTLKDAVSFFRGFQPSYFLLSLTLTSRGAFMRAGPLSILLLHKCRYCRCTMGWPVKCYPETVAASVLIPTRHRVRPTTHANYKKSSYGLQNSTRCLLLFCVYSVLTLYTSKTLSYTLIMLVHTQEHIHSTHRCTGLYMYCF